MDRASRRATLAWLALIAATGLSFWAAEHLSNRIFAIAAIMTIAGVKILTVLKQFMELDRAALPVRIYFHAWTIGCAAAIFGGACFAMT